MNNQHQYRTLVVDCRFHGVIFLKPTFGEHIWNYESHNNSHNLFDSLQTSNLWNRRVKLFTMFCLFFRPSAISVSHKVLKNQFYCTWNLSRKHQILALRSFLFWEHLNNFRMSDEYLYLSEMNKRYLIDLTHICNIELKYPSRFTIMWPALKLFLC